MTYDRLSETRPTPPGIHKPGTMTYVWLACILFLVFSVVGVGAYVIDAESNSVPSGLETLLTPTPLLPLEAEQKVIPTLSEHLPARSEDASHSGAIGSSSAQGETSHSAEM